MSACIKYEKDKKKARETINQIIKDKVQHIESMDQLRNKALKELTQINDKIQ